MTQASAMQPHMQTSIARVSVVIPLYNHAPYIGAAIDSVLSQSYPAAEIIVIDDGSSDGSAERMREICAAHPEVIFWSWPNQGAHLTLNAAILRATGDFVAVLNSDDCFHPDRLAECVAAANARPDVDLVATGVRFIDGNDNPVRNAWYEDAVEFFRTQGSVPLALFHGNFLVSTSNFFVRRSAFDRAGYFAPLRYAHDLEFVLRLAGGGRRVHFVDTPLLDYRQHGRNTIGEDTWREDSERAAIFAFFLHDQWLRERLNEAELQRYVDELDHQHLAGIVAHFLEQLAASEPRAARKLSRREAQAFRDFQQQLGIDWLQRDLRDPALLQCVQARRQAFEREAAWERAVRDCEGQVQSLDAALREAMQAKDWLADQRDAWERIGRQHEAQLRSMAAALHELSQARDWLAGQRDAWERVTREHEAQLHSMAAGLQELAQAKDWLAGQRDAWERQARAAHEQAEQMASRAAELGGLLSESGKERSRLDAELGRARTELDGMRIALDQVRTELHELRAERDRLRADVHGLLRRRAFRLLLRLRLVELRTLPPTSAAPSR